MTEVKQGSPAEVLGRAREPVVFRGLASAWPALSRWTPDYLARLAGDRTVEVVVGDRESYEPVFRTIPLHDFFHAWPTGDAEGSPSLYLKEFDLFGAFPQLQEDVDFAALERPSTKAWRYAWISQAGGRTNLHHDLLNNVLTQVVGRKLVTLIPPARSADVYPSDKFDCFARLSRVDAFNPDFDRFPRYRSALAAERQVTLEPGDAVYIPSGWWHTARSLTASISLAGFFARRIDYLTAVWPEEFRLALHNRGLYKRGKCTCHAAAA